MKRILQLTACILGITFFCGCLDVATVVVVDKDGSGYVVETAYIGKAMEEMMSQMAAGFGGAGGEVSSPGVEIKEEEYKAKAEKMGIGVKYDSAKKVKKADGSEGIQVRYSFKDITKLQLSMNPDNPMQGGGMGGPAGAEEEKVGFGFTGGSNPKLTINLPRPDKSEMGEEPAEMGQGSLEDIPPQQMEMMKKMFDGFRIRMMVKVNGEITKSNASHVSKSKKSGKKCYATLFDMNIGELMKNEEQFKKMASMGQMESMDEAMEKLKDIPGLKIEPAEKVTIEFK